MNRLTEPKGNRYNDYTYNEEAFDDGEDREQQVLNYLGKLENIEDELGIDLVTFIKALKEGVYVIDSDENIVFEEPMISFNQEKSTNLYVLDGVVSYPPDKLCKSFNYYFKDYGKTWALTREELEGGKDE